MSDARTISTKASKGGKSGFYPSLSNDIIIEEKANLDVSNITEFVDSGDEIEPDPDYMPKCDESHISNKQATKNNSRDNSMNLETQNAYDINLKSTTNDNIQQQYLTLSSNGFIIGNNDFSTNPINTSKGNPNMMNSLLVKQNYLIFFIEFSYFFLMKWTKEYLLGVYPETNLIVTIDFDDDKSTQEKIVLNRSDEKNKYLPMLNSQDLNKKCGHRSVKFLSYKDSRAHKLKIQIFTFSNNRATLISKEEIFINTKEDYEMHRFQLYPNIMSINNGKKIGNAFLTFMYKNDEMGAFLNEDKEEMNNRYLSIFSVSINYSDIS